MYSKQYAEYIIQFQFDKRHHEIALKILNLVPESGILELPISSIAERLNKSESEIHGSLEIMRHHKISLVRYSDDQFIFDYPEKDIDYVKHLRRALSNMGALE